MGDLVMEDLEQRFWDRRWYGNYPTVVLAVVLPVSIVFEVALSYVPTFPPIVGLLDFLGRFSAFLISNSLVGVIVGPLTARMGWRGHGIVGLLGIIVALGGVFLGVIIRDDYIFSWGWSLGVGIVFIQAALVISKGIGAVRMGEASTWDGSPGREFTARGTGRRGDAL